MKRVKTLSLLLALVMLFSLVPVTACGASPADDIRTIVLTSARSAGGWTHSATLDGVAVKEYDYTWHCDPSETHSEVKEAPAEYYTGTKPGDDGVYIAHDIYYYPQLPSGGFVRKTYDGEQEWCYYYTDGVNNGYIFATLPVQGNSLPTQMMHTPAEAWNNAVLHITQPGTYALQGTWHGQIWIDLGDSASTDPNAVVTILLNGVDVTCTVAPALVFRNVYECDNAWESRDTHSPQVNTADAGANVLLVDGTQNNFSGTNVYRMLKTAYKKGQEGAAVPVQKKMRKTDAAFYSYMSMNVAGGTKGTGVLNVTSGFEGLDSELHLTFSGGNVNVFSQDDGVNVNEDGVSVVSFNGGNVHILAGLGSEGDGVDSNGFLVVNGGAVISMANPRSDSGLDSDCGSYINGGTVVALGSTMDWAESDGSESGGQATMNLRFSSSQSSDEAIIVTDRDGKVVFAYDPDQDEVAGSRIRGYQGAVISFPGLTQGNTYRVYVGGDVSGVETAGVYRASSVTGFTADAKLQSYAGTWENTGRPGGMGGFDPNGRPDGFDFGRDPGQRPEGGRMPDGQTPPDFDTDGQTPPDFDPNGQTPPDFDPDQFPGGKDFGGRDFGGKDFGGAGGDDLPRSTDFTMTAKVNNFSQVADAQESPAAAPVVFTDVADNAWYSEGVRWAASMGIIDGTGDGKFEPLSYTTRAQVVSLLWRLEGSPAVSYAMNFTDVAHSAWYAQAVRWAASQGIVQGDDKNAFHPSDPITREALATLLYRYVQVKAPALIDGTSSVLNFPDAGHISSWANTAMQWMVRQGLFTGDSSGRLAPSATANRAQLATLLQRYYDLLQTAGARV